MANGVTLVSALFDIGRESLDTSESRSISTYLAWSELLLSLETPVVLFTSPELAPTIRELRGDKPLRLTVLTDEELKSCETYHKVVNLIDEPRPRPDRPERVLPLYNVIMFSKCRWLAGVARDNPFRSEYFLWIDAGYTHGKPIGHDYLDSGWPERPEVLDDGRIHVLQTHPVPATSEEDRYYHHQTYLAGGCFGGNRESIFLLSDRFEGKLHETLDRGLMDDDQAVLGSVHQDDPDFFRLVGPTYGRYFEMLPYLRNGKVKKSMKGWVEDHPFKAVGLAIGTALGLGAAYRWNRERRFGDLFRIAILDVCDVMEAVGATYWFTEGTLIALLRYGKNEPEVDDDIDIMVEARDHEHWLQIAEAVRRGLAARGWTWGKIYPTYHKPGARADKMQCHFTKYGCRTHLDLHSYFLDKEKKAVFSHGTGDSYPFQFWGGYCPETLIYPLAKCLCYGRSVPCPNRPLDILRGWHGGEYKDSNLAYPPGKVSDEMRELIEARAKELDAQGFHSMLPELSR